MLGPAAQRQAQEAPRRPEARAEPVGRCPAAGQLAAAVARPLPGATAEQPQPEVQAADPQPAARGGPTLL